MHRTGLVVVLCCGRVRGLEVVVNSLLRAGEAAKELLGQLEGIGQVSCPLPGSLFPSVELCPPQSIDVSLGLLSGLLGRLSQLHLLPL